MGVWGVGVGERETQREGGRERQRERGRGGGTIKREGERRVGELKDEERVREIMCF